VFAQEYEVKVRMVNLPEAVRKTVREQSRGATIRGLAKEIEGGKTFYEAELRINGHNKDVLIDSTGAVVEIEEQISIDSLPAKVKTTLLEAAGKGRILNVESITKNNTLDAYEAHITKSGKKVEIKISIDGVLITSPDNEIKKPSGKNTQKSTKP